MSVPIAVVGCVLKMRMSSGVISEPPPMPVMPTRTPMPKPKRTIAGSIIASRAWYLIDFSDLLGQEHGVRQDTKMATKTREFGAGTKSPAPGRHGAPVSIRALDHSYGELATIDGLDLEVAAGGVLGVVGPSGCGKSTLLELICGLREQGAGKIEVGGESGPAARLARCAFMPQRDMLFPWLSALDNAALALRNRGFGKSEARRQAASLFGLLGLTGFERTPPAELSGGMRQRVAFLRTLVSDKPVL